MRQSGTYFIKKEQDCQSARKAMGLALYWRDFSLLFASKQGKAA